MLRTLLWIVAGVLLGLIIHIIVILSLPSLASKTAWDRVGALGAVNQVKVLPPVVAGADNPLGLDPKLVYAVCEIDLTDGPAAINGTLPDDFWSVSVVDRQGVSIYSTTNRSGIGNTLDLAIFDPTQSQLLAAQKFDIEQGFLIVQSPVDQVFVTVRLAPPHPEMWPRYARVLADALKCAGAAPGDQAS